VRSGLSGPTLADQRKGEQETMCLSRRQDRESPIGCVTRFTGAAQKAASPTDLKKVIRFVDEATGGFTPGRWEHLRERANVLRSAPAAEVQGVYKAYKQLQARGDLHGLKSEEVLAALLIGLAGDSAPERFLPDTFHPEVTNPIRSELASTLYWIDAFLVSRDVARWLGWHGSRAVAIACHQEILSRLAQYPTSVDVYRLIFKDDFASYRRLFDQASSRTRRLYTSGASPSSDDEKSSVLNTLLGEAVTECRDANHPIELLRLAMDGQFNFVPNRVKSRFISHLRSQSAQKRGGNTTTVRFQDLGEAWESEVASTGRGTFRRSGGSRQILQVEIDDDGTTDILRRERLDRFATAEASGSLDQKSAELLRTILKDPDQTDRQLAQRLGVTVRTIRNRRKVLVRHRTTIAELLVLFSGEANRQPQDE
jgi:hypothetical protein